MSVSLVHVTKTFEDRGRAGGLVTAVDDLSIEVAEGEFVTLLGPSGCGKTTTLRMVAGFEDPSSGDIVIGGRRVNEVPPNKRDTTMVFQSYAIFPHLSVEQNVGFGLELRGRPRDEIRREVGRIMEVMDLGSLAKRRPDQLSGGQQQRVALARAVVNKPGVLLFDEPLSNLDAKLRELMRLEIRRVQQAFGITSIYVTHDQAEAMTVSDRIAVMREGVVMQVGTPFEIYSRPDNRFVADFIGRANFIEGRVGERLGAGWLLETPRGKVLAESAAPGLSPGSPALLVVRPESLRLGSAPPGGASPSPPSAGGEGVAGESFFASGRVTKAVYLGSVIEYEIEAGLPRPILALFHNPVEQGFFKVGDEVSVSFSARAAHAIPVAD